LPSSKNSSKKDVSDDGGSKPKEELKLGDEFLPVKKEYPNDEDENEFKGK